MQNVKGLLESLRNKIEQRLLCERDAAEKRGEELRLDMSRLAEFASLARNTRNAILEGFTTFVQKMELEKLIPVIRDGIRRFEENEYPRMIAQILAVAADAARAAAEAAGSLQEPGSPPYFPPTSAAGSVEAPQAQDVVEVIPIRSVKAPFDRPLLISEADVDAYLDSMRTRLLEEIRQGKRIQV